MSLNPIVLNLGTGGDSLGADLISGTKYQVGKMAFGAEGSITLVSSGAPLPVTASITGSVAVTGTFWQATQPVSLTSTTITGTVAVTQSGTWNVTNISGTISLPTGAATAAKQPALGTAGTPSPDVITVQGVTSMTPFKVDGSGFTQPVSGTFWQATQPVSLTSTTITGTVTVGTHAVTQSGTWTVTGAGGTFPMTDSGGSITVDAPVGTPVFVRLSDGTSAITTLPVSLSSLPALAAGTNNIGDVDVLTIPALAAGTNLIGKAAAGLDVSNLYDGSTAVVPKFAKLSSASTGNQALVSAVVGKKLRLLSLQILATASTNAVYINDGTADLYGDSTRKIPLDVTGATGPGGITLPFNPIGWCESAATNRPLNINLGSANGIIALATYVEV